MTPDETLALLAYVTATDTRFATVDDQQATARVQVWADLLSGVDAQFALDTARRYYASEAKWPLQPGTIRQAWGNHQRVVEAKARYDALLVTREQLVEDLGHREPSEAQQAARAAMEAAQGTGPVPARVLAAIPRPVRDDVFEGGLHQ